MRARVVPFALAAVATLLPGCERGARPPPAHPTTPVFVATSATSVTPSATALPECGRTTPVTLLPTGVYGLRAGPFGFLGRPSRTGPTVVTSPPSKVVFQVMEAYTAAYEVSGFRCTDGAPMRFWYGHADPIPSPAPPGTGDLRAPLPPATVERPGGIGHGGYLLPSSPGRWRLDFRTGGRLVHSVIVDLVFDD